MASLQTNGEAPRRLATGQVLFLCGDSSHLWAQQNGSIIWGSYAMVESLDVQATPRPSVCDALGYCGTLLGGLQMMGRGDPAHSKLSG